MNAFRALLLIILVAIGIYTAPVVANHGINLFPYFFGDIAKMGGLVNSTWIFLVFWFYPHSGLHGETNTLEVG